MSESQQPHINDHSTPAPDAVPPSSGGTGRAGSGTSGVRAQPREDQPSGAVTRMSGALGEISPSAMTSTEANLSVLVMSKGRISEKFQTCLSQTTWSW